MVIRKLYSANCFPGHMVVETLEGKYMSFLVSPVRTIKENDLSPVSYYQAKGRNAEEAPTYLYTMYGLKKIRSKRKITFEERK